jgi:hypothetical protein
MSAITKDQLIALARRTTDPEWLEPLLADPSSDAVVETVAQVFAEVSKRSQYNCNQGLITNASAGGAGNSFVTLYQPTAPSPPFLVVPQLNAGLGFVDKRGGLHTQDQTIIIPGSQFDVAASSARHIELINTVDDPVFSIAPVSNVTDATSTSPIRIKTSQPHGYVNTSSYPGTAWPPPQAVWITGVTGNTAANGLWQTVVVIDPTTIELTGSVFNGTYDGGGLVQNAPWNCVIKYTSPTVNASSNYLGVLGKERGKQSQLGELAENYRARVRNIDDVVSPIAMSLAVRGSAQSVGVNDVRLYEPFEDGSTAALDTLYGLGSLTEMLFCDSTNQGVTGNPFSYAVDDPYSVTLSARESLVYFLVRVFDVAASSDFGFGTLTYPPEVVGGLLAVYDSAQYAKAGGVPFDIHLAGTFKWVVGVGTRTSAIGAVVVTLTPPPGKVWVSYAIISGRTGATVSGGYFEVVIDRSSFGPVTLPTQTPAISTASQVVHSGEAFSLIADTVTEVRGTLASDGVTLNSLTVALLVNEIDA